MILVTGGTGLVGSHLLFQLTLKNSEVTAIYRTEQKLQSVKKVFSYYTDDVDHLFKKIKWLKADILNIPSLETAFKDIIYVYHCAAYISFDPSDLHTLEKVNIEGTANIVNMCITHKIKKLCYVSTIGTIGKNTNENIVNEESEWTKLNANPYAITKYLGEMEVWRGAQEQVPIVIVNPGIILGPGFGEEGSGALFKTAAKEYNYYPPGGTGFISVNDVVKIMLRLMESNITGERYITVAENLSFEKILEKIAFSMGKKPPKKVLAYWQLQVLCFLDWLRSIFTNRGRTITKKTIYSLKNPVVFNVDKLQEALEYKFDTIDETIAFCAKHFIEKPL